MFFYAFKNRDIKLFLATLRLRGKMLLAFSRIWFNLYVPETDTA